MSDEEGTPEATDPEEYQGLPRAPEAILEIPAPDVKAELTFTKEDVVKIKYAKEEKRLLARRKELEGEVKSLKTLKTSAEKKLTELLDSDTDCLPPDMVLLADALRGLGAVKIMARTVRSLHDTDKCGKVTTGEEVTMVTGVAVCENEELTYIMEEHGRSHPGFGPRATYRRPNEAEAALIDNLDENAKLTEAREEDLFKTKEAIGSLPAFMRQLEAAMAQYVLGSTSEGRTLMQALEDVETMLPKALEAPIAP